MNDPRIQQLLDSLLDSHSTPEEVCNSCPELLAEVRERWRQMCRVQADLNALFPPPSEPSLRPPCVSVGEETDLPRIPGYEVQAVLGRGGMGIVFRARHLRLNRVVALKMTLAGAYTAPHERIRFQREAEVVAGLQHPNVVQVYDIGDHEGHLYFTMEYVEGGSLAQKLAGTPQPASQAADLVATLARAVQAAHQSGIVHRDLKPANVLLAGEAPPAKTQRRKEDEEQREGSKQQEPNASDPSSSSFAPLRLCGRSSSLVPRITDFGLAKKLDEAGQTHPGAIMGTPSYMAPEQARGNPDAVGPAADVYALGAILYEMLTGRPPFRAATAAETVQQVISQDPVPPRQLNPRVPRDLETICFRCLHKEPSRRYPSAGALADDLQRYLEGRPILARPMSRPERAWRWCRRNPRETALAGLALLVLLLVGEWAWWSDRQRTKRQGEQALQEAQTRQGAEWSLGHGGTMRRQARWAEAKEALEQAALLIGNEGPEDLRQRLAQSRLDLRMAETLDGIGQAKAMIVEGSFDTTQASLAYAQAFRNHGLAMQDMSVAQLADRIRASEIKKELVDALDDWIFLEPGQLVEKIAQVASAADPSSWRDQVRQAAARRNGVAQALLAETAPMTEQSVPLLVALMRRFSYTENERVAIACGGASNVGFLASPAGVGSLLTAFARISAGIHPVRCLRRLQQEHQDDFWINLTLGNALATKEPGEAIRFYQAALAIRKLSPAVLNNLGFSLTTKGQADEAINYLRRAVQINPNDVQVRNNLGAALALQGRLDEAISHFQQVLRIDPRSVRAWYHLGFALQSKGRTNEALEHFQRAVNIDPRFAAAQSSLLDCLLRKGRTDDALEHFQQVLRNDPENAQARNHLGVALGTKGQLGDAIKQFQQVLRIHPDNARAHTNLGISLLRQGLIDEAIAQYRKAVAIDPKHLPTQKGLRNILMRLGRLAEARKAWELALQTNPPEHDAWYGYAEFCLFLGQDDEYRQARHALLGRFGSTTDPQISERTARACLLLPSSGDELRQAVALAERAVAADRSRYQGVYPHFLFVRGLAEYRQGRFDRAISTMRGDASQVFGPAPRLVLAMALHRNGQAAQARKRLAEAVLAHDWRANQVRDQDGWIFHVLRREAERLILPAFRDPPSGPP